MTKIARVLLSSRYDAQGQLIGETYRVDGGKIHATHLGHYKWREEFEPDPDPDIALHRENSRAARGL